METRAEALYDRWIELYDDGDPVRAMELTAPGFVMVTPDGRKLGRDEAVEFTKQIKAYVDGLGLRRKTTIKSLLATRIGDSGWLIHATVDLVFTTPGGQENRLPFVEVMAVGPRGITFDAFSKLADSQSFF